MDKDNNNVNNNKQYWVISDMHFNDNHCLKFRSEFNSLEQMRKTIIKNCQEFIDKNDTVFILGDIGSGHEGIRWVSQIGGKQKIGWGNHDKNGLQLYQQLLPKAQFRAWYKIGPVILSHFPIHPQELEYDGLFAPRFNIHGHVHSKTIPDDRYINVCVDVNDWKPLNLKELFERFNLTLSDYSV